MCRLRARLRLTRGGPWRESYTGHLEQGQKCGTCIVRDSLLATSSPECFSRGFLVAQPEAKKAHRPSRRPQDVSSAKCSDWNTTEMVKRAISRANRLLLVHNAPLFYTL